MDSDQTSGKKSGVKNRGFASMEPERQRALARQGGAAVPALKRSFSQNRSLAAEAGRKGGQTSKKGKAEEPRSGLLQGSLLDTVHPQKEF